MHNRLFQSSKLKWMGFVFLLMASIMLVGFGFTRQAIAQESTGDTAAAELTNQTENSSPIIDELSGITYRITKAPVMNGGIQVENGAVSVAACKEIHSEQSAAFGSFIIPETIDSNGCVYDVTSMDAYAFNGCQTIKTVVIPDCVATIDPSAFMIESSTLQNGPADTTQSVAEFYKPQSIYCNPDSAAESFAEAKDIPVNLKGITLSLDKKSVESGGTARLSIEIPDFLDQTAAVSYRSLDETLASVDGQGIVTAKNSGRATLETTVLGLHSSVKLTITKAAADQLETAAAKPTVSYSTHVQNIGWQESKTDGDISGTTGQALRLEAIKIALDDSTTANGGGISYCTHVQNIGWQDWVSNGELSGTQGQAKRLEAIKIKLTGDLAEKYDVYYSVHAQNYGWMDWAKNGEPAGTSGLAYRLEAIKIVIVPKTESAPGSTANAFYSNETIVKNGSISYKAHVENIGWQDWVKDKEDAGTTGKGLRMEAIQVALSGTFVGSVQYRCHVQDIGWQDWVSNGNIAGTVGQAKRVEGIQIQLTDVASDLFDVYYRVHVQNYGWLDWAKNGESAGSQGAALRAEAIEIVLVPKGGAAPGETGMPFVDATAGGRLAATAKSQIGYLEATNGYTKYGDWYEAYHNAPGYRYGEWCAMFVSWCANQTGIPDGTIPYHSYCPSGKEYFESQGRYRYNGYVPSTGDIIYFDWDFNGVPNHVGIVTSYSNGIIHTVEGNTGPNENVVMEKAYPYNWAYINGFGVY